jgi:FMN phosphatase YigB (HAD superfamily)
VIFDLGDVLFSWSPSTPKSPLPAKTLKQILRTSTWFEYEKGNLTEEEAYSNVANELNISASDVASAFGAARDSLKSNPTLLEVIREIKGAGRNIFAMSNISAPDWEVLSTKANPNEWALFDQVFTSYVHLDQISVFHDTIMKLLSS